MAGNVLANFSIDREFVMSPIRMAVLSLCLGILGYTGSTLASSEDEKQQGLVVLVAMEQVCNNANPGMKSDVENAMASDPTIDEATKTEVRKIKSDPAYKSKVSSTAENLIHSPMGAYVAQDLCKNYGAK
ncbi:hypothetical protein NLO88_03115 [Pseudomonas syringae]|nr:hypothetical protein [Pseudomonas syringae]MCQ3001719.1 hypothetical protein [Pseudomonas syringae]MCQ3029642.1 hypothetical protein [Pseudomonas syringae]MDG6399942.1 hypothetical protein [Pseudomonas quasicaspiana]